VLATEWLPDGKAGTWCKALTLFLVHLSKDESIFIRGIQCEVVPGRELVAEGLPIESKSEEVIPVDSSTPLASVMYIAAPN